MLTFLNSSILKRGSVALNSFSQPHRIMRDSAGRVRERELPKKTLNAYSLRMYLEFSNRAQQGNSKALKIRKFVLHAEQHLLRPTYQPQYLS